MVWKTWLLFIQFFLFVFDIFCNNFFNSDKQQTYLYSLRDTEPNLLNEGLLSQENKIALDEIKLSYNVIPLSNAFQERLGYDHYHKEFYLSLFSNNSSSDNLLITPNNLEVNLMMHEIYVIHINITNTFDHTITIDQIKSDTSTIDLNVHSQTFKSYSSISTEIFLPMTIPQNESSIISFSYIPNQEGFFYPTIYFSHYSFSNSDQCLNQNTLKKISSFSFKASVVSAPFIYEPEKTDVVLNKNTKNSFAWIKNPSTNISLFLSNLTSQIGIEVSQEKKCYQNFTCSLYTNIPPETTQAIWKFNYDFQKLDLKIAYQGYITFRVFGYKNEFALKFFFYTGSLSIYFPQTAVDLGILTRQETIHAFPLIIGNHGDETFTIHDVKYDISSTHEQTFRNKIMWLPFARANSQLQSASQRLLGTFYAIPSHNFKELSTIGKLKIIVSHHSKYTSYDIPLYLTQYIGGVGNKDINFVMSLSNLELQNKKEMDPRTNTMYHYMQDDSIIITKNITIDNQMPLTLNPELLYSNIKTKKLKPKQNIIKPGEIQENFEVSLTIKINEIDKIEFQKFYLIFLAYGSFITYPITLIDNYLYCSLINNGMKTYGRCKKYQDTFLNLGYVREHAVLVEGFEMFNPSIFPIKLSESISNPNENVNIISSIVYQFFGDIKNSYIPISQSLPNQLDGLSAISIIFKIITGSNITQSSLYPIVVSSSEEVLYFNLYYVRLSGSITIPQFGDAPNNFRAYEKDILVNISLHNTYPIEVNILSTTCEDPNLKVSILNNILPPQKTTESLRISISYVSILKQKDDKDNRIKEYMSQSHGIDGIALLTLTDLIKLINNAFDMMNLSFSIRLKTTLHEEIPISTEAYLPLPQIVNKTMHIVGIENTISSHFITVVNPFPFTLEITAFLIYDNYKEMIQQQKIQNLIENGVNNLILDIYEYSSNKPESSVNSVNKVSLTGYWSTILEYFWKFFPMQFINKNKFEERERYTHEKIFRLPYKLSPDNFLFIDSNYSKRLQEQEFFLNSSYFQKTVFLGSGALLSLPLILYAPKTSTAQAYLLIKTNMSTTIAVQLNGAVKKLDIETNLPNDVLYLKVEAQNFVYDLDSLKNTKNSFDIINYSKENLYINEIKIDSKNCNNHFIAINDCQPFQISSRQFRLISLQVNLHHEVILKNAVIEIVGLGFYKKIDVIINEGIYYNRNMVYMENLVLILLLIIFLLLNKNFINYYLNHKIYYDHKLSSTTRLHHAQLIFKNSFTCSTKYEAQKASPNTLIRDVSSKTFNFKALIEEPIFNDIRISEKNINKALETSLNAQNPAIGLDDFQNAQILFDQSISKIIPEENKIINKKIIRIQI